MATIVVFFYKKKASLFDFLYQGLKVMISVPSLRGVLRRYYPILWKRSKGLLREQRDSNLDFLVRSELVKLIIALVVQVTLSTNRRSLSSTLL